MNECLNCGFYNSDYEDCTCPSYERWYACPIENKKPENIQALKDCEDFFAEARACAESEDKE